MAEETQEATETLTISNFLSSMRFAEDVPEHKPMLGGDFDQIEEGVSTEQRFVSGLAALVSNMDPEQGKFDKASIQDLVQTIDQLVNDQLNEVIHNAEFQELESTWRGIDDLCKNTNFGANIEYSILDVRKDELMEDLEDNTADIAGSALFKKVYVSEYDQYGGKPYGGMIGMYEFGNTPDDLLFLRTMGKVATASHAPFVGSASAQFFGCKDMAEVAQLRDIEGLMSQPKYGTWNALRDSEEAAYIGLALPKYIARLPYHPETNPCRTINFTEEVRGDLDSQYLWGNAVMLHARNMAKSFESSGWCQYMRGPKGGGLISGLPVHTFNLRGEEEIKIPVEITIPDYRELEFAKCGFIPLVYRKGTGDAVFFSVQSIKSPKTFKDPKDTENAHLVTNLTYCYSISRIAHYLKCIMRDNIGSSADGDYVANQIDTWISRYITTVQNPDDLTLRYYPFKAYSIDVNAIDGKPGWYDCKLSILPHIQFEGMDVELRIESRLG